MKVLLLSWFKLALWKRVLAAFVFGAFAGWLIGEPSVRWFGPLGTLYLTLIKMIAVPLVFFAVVDAVAKLHGQRRIAALGGRTFLWFALTAVGAVAVGLAVALALNPGLGVSGLAVATGYVPKVVPGPVEVLLDVVPANPFAALANGKILQVLFFAALVGAALVALGERASGLRTLATEASAMMMRITRWVLQTTPMGTFGLIAALVGGYGFDKLLPLAQFVIALYLACALHIAFVYSGLLLAHGLNPLRFFRGAAAGMQVGFVSSSSFASMPVALRCVTVNLGVNRDYAAFAVPLGASIKMDGCGAIYPAIAAVFTAQYFGIELSGAQYFVILLASVLGSFGTAGVPGTAIVMATVVLGAAGLPLEGLGYLVAIDRVLDMMRTMTNVTGQMLVPVLVAREEGLLDKAIYDAPVAEDDGSGNDPHEASA